jgi:lysophospholipase L1-like esterase
MRRKQTGLFIGCIVTGMATFSLVADDRINFESPGDYVNNFRHLAGSGTALQTDPTVGEPDNDTVRLSSNGFTVTYDTTPGDGAATRNLFTVPFSVVADIRFGTFNNSYGIYFINPDNESQAYLALFNVEASGASDQFRFSTDGNPLTSGAGTLIQTALIESGVTTNGKLNRIEIGYGINAQNLPVLSIWAGIGSSSLVLTGQLASATAGVGLRFSPRSPNDMEFDNLAVRPVPAVWAPPANQSGSRLVRRLAAGEPQKVVVYGTSLTAGGIWPGQMQSWLTNTYAGALTLINSGLSGKNSKYGLEQLSSKVLAHKPDTVFIEFGMNDAFTNYTGADAVYNISVGQARSNLLAMIDQILLNRPDTEIILQTMNPAWDSPGGSGTSVTVRPELPECYQTYRDVATERGLLVIDHYPAWKALQLTDPATFRSYVSDGTHPNAAGYTSVAMPLLKQRLIGEVKSVSTNRTSLTRLDADICVYGGTSAGVTAAVQAARQGKTCVLISPDLHFGGLTSGGLGWTDLGSDTAVIGGLAREFYKRVYLTYLDTSAWVHETRTAYISRSSIDPNDATRQMYTFEPKVTQRLFREMLAESGVTVLPGRLLRNGHGVTKEGTTIRELYTDDGHFLVRAKMFIDATYEGDLLAEAGVTYTVGREPNALYGETLNGIQTARATGNQLVTGIDPYVIKLNPSSGRLPFVEETAGGADGAGDGRLQAYCYRMCLTDVATNRVMIAQPAGYQESDFELFFRAIEAGQITRFFKTSPMPNRKTDSNNDNGFSTDFIGGNYNLTEGWNYAEADYGQREQIQAAHRYYQQGFVWTLQNHSRVPVAIRSAWSSWGLPLDEFDETGHWPFQLYVREARRMVSDLVITQHHVNQTTGFIADDPVGMAVYTMDSHHVQRHVSSAGYVRNEGDVQVAPAKGAYGISYRALVPKVSEVSNLLVPVCLSASHIAYGSIRMEPVFMVLGQSAAAAAAQAIDDGVSVQLVDYAKLKPQLDAMGQVLSKATTTSSADVIVDNTDASGVTVEGTWTASSATGGYWGSNYLHDGDVNKGLSAVTFIPVLPASRDYDVYVRWTSHANRATNALVVVVHPAGTNTFRVNQQINNGIWVKLLTTNFTAGAFGKVIIRNDDSSGYVVADAVRFSTDRTSVSLVVPDPVASEVGSDTARVLVVRSGSTALPLTVYYATAGTATASADYESLPGSVTLPAGATSASLIVRPYADALAEGDEQVTITLATNASYDLAPPSSTDVTILDRRFDDWRHARFTLSQLENDSVSGDTADPDGDRLSNAEEYAFGSNPWLPDATAVAPYGRLVHDQDGGSWFRLEYLKEVPGIECTVKRTTSLTAPDWTTNGVSEEYYLPSVNRFAREVPAGEFYPVQFLRLMVDF